MRTKFAAQARSLPGRAAAAPPQPGVHVDAAMLAALEAEARDFHFMPRQPVHSLLTGRHASKLRGRGLAFEELRPYLPGDDIRTMDWRVTARTGQPHVRVYSEEKDRPVRLLVDQRMNMFFGTRRAMKSVVAAEVAALVAWRTLAEGDRVGGYVFGDTELTELRPKRSRDAVQHLLGEVVRHNQSLRADLRSAADATAQLNAVLGRVARSSPHDELIVVISDFKGRDASTRDLLLQMSARNDLLAVLVHDPFLSQLPTSGELVVSDGDLQVELGFARDALHRGVRSVVEEHASELRSWQQGIGVPLLPISTAEDTAHQLRHLLGQQTPDMRRGQRRPGG
jgi:uncharacterized protein (DUF58 family)